ncbi:MAG: hypothetical protein IKT52_09885 [Oscillospiraceae bacterium]|nr:hypothetical protein [Oscillospiraceae bacterium]
MNSKDLIQSMNYVGDDLVNEAEHGRFSVRNEQAAQPRRWFRKPLLIAALIGLMVFLMGCAIYVLKMQDLNLGQEDVTYDVFDDDTMEYLGQETYTQEVFTLTGLEGTPTYLASKEWYDFKQTYDPNYQILESVKANYPEFPAEYGAYGLYSQEMKDKLDEILSKHGLKPMGARLEFRTLRNMLNALGIEKLQTVENEITIDVDMGSCYENGNFALTLNFTWPETAENELNATWGNLRWNRADCFSDDLFAIQQTGDWKEWNYKTTSGDDVLIIRSDSDWRSWIICKRTDGILSLQVESRLDAWNNVDGKTWADEYFLTDKQMEQLADAIDFAVQPRVATQEDVKNQPAPPNEATQDGYTVKLKSVETDGWIARIVMSITAPEGKVISRNPVPGLEDVHYNIGTTNFDSFEPKTGRLSSGSGGWNAEEDGDGLDNTQDLVLEARYNMQDGSAPFAPGKTWIIRFEDLVGSYWDSKNLKNVEEQLATGEWTFEVDFNESNGDYREIELLTEPVEIGVSTGWKPDGTDVVEDVTVSSIKLRKYSLTITHDGPEYTDFSYINGQKMCAVMKDGSTIEILGTGRVYQAYGEIDFEQLDYIQLADGTKLTIPTVQSVG